MEDIEYFRKVYLLNAINKKLILMEKIIEVLINIQEENGLSRILQKNIGRKIDRNVSCVSNTMKNLKKMIDV